MYAYRQGDVLLFPITMPSEAKKTEDKIIAYGESTGHAHRISDQGIIFNLPTSKKRFLRVLPGGLDIIHEEHENLNLPEGEYEIKIQREWDWYSEVVRYVAD